MGDNGPRRTRLLSFILVLSGLMAAGALPARAAGAALVFVLDASGSMVSPVPGNQSRIAAAKAVMGDLLKDVPANVDVGLVAYGHRRAGDCADIETIAPLGTDPGAIARAVDAIVPRGETPLAAALRQAAGLLAGRTGPATVVLVSDGVETCKGDPCALARELAGRGLKLVIHTVGLGVDAKAAKQLGCIARAAGGTYYPAASAAALRTSLFTVREAAAKGEAPAPAVAPSRTAVLKSKSKTVRIVGPGTIKLAPAPWVKLPIYAWTVLDSASGEEKGSANGDHLRIKSGTYRLVWHQYRFQSPAIPLPGDITVRNGQVTTVPIDTGVQIVPPQGTPVPYHWSLHRAGEDKVMATFSGSLEPEVVPPGRYQVIWQESRFQAPPVPLGTVEVAAGKLARLTLDQGFVARRADWVAEYPYEIWLVDAAGAKVGPWKTFGAHLAPPGTYKVIYQEDRYATSPLPWGTVTVGDTGFAPIDVNSGIKFTPQAGAKPPYRAFFVDLDTGKEHFWAGGDTWRPVPLPPGRYRLDWWEERFSTKRMTILDEFTVEPGTLVEFQM